MLTMWQIVCITGWVVGIFFIVKAFKEVEESKCVKDFLLGIIIPCVCYFIYLNHWDIKNITSFNYWYMGITFAISGISFFILVSGKLEEIFASEEAKLFAIVGLMIVSLFFDIPTEQYVKPIREQYNTNVLVEKVTEVDEIPIYTIDTSSTVSGEVSGGMFVVSGSVNSEFVYLYRYRNSDGELVLDHVTADKEKTSISDTLIEEQQPFLRIIRTYWVKTDYNIEPPVILEKEYDSTKYKFFLPETAVREIKF